MDRGTLARVAAGLAVFVHLSGCQWREESLPMPGADVMRADWGVVLPVHEQVALPKSCARPSSPGFSGPWSPSRAHIDRLERRLPRVVSKALARVVLEKDETLPRPSDYYRQYGGF